MAVRRCRSDFFPAPRALAAYARCACCRLCRMHSGEHSLNSLTIVSSRPHRPTVDYQKNVGWKGTKVSTSKRILEPSAHSRTSTRSLLLFGLGRRTLVLLLSLLLALLLNGLRRPSCCCCRRSACAAGRCGLLRALGLAILLLLLIIIVLRLLLSIPAGREARALSRPGADLFPSARRGTPRCCRAHHMGQPTVNQELRTSMPAALPPAPAHPNSLARFLSTR